MGRCLVLRGTPPPSCGNANPSGFPDDDGWRVRPRQDLDLGAVRYVVERVVRPRTRADVESVSARLEVESLNFRVEHSLMRFGKRDRRAFEVGIHRHEPCAIEGRETDPKGRSLDGSPRFVLQA